MLVKAKCTAVTLIELWREGYGTPISNNTSTDEALIQACCACGCRSTWKESVKKVSRPESCPADSLNYDKDMCTECWNRLTTEAEVVMARDS